MKKLQALIISLLFLITNNIQASFLQGPNPYSFGPQGRAVSDLRDFAKPKNMVRILPNRPVAATNSDGSRVYYTPDGKMTLSVSKDGSMSFSLGGVSKSYNSDGEKSGITRTVRGSGLLQEVRDKDERLLGYRTLNGDGKVSQAFDKDKNLTTTYTYTGQGAKVASVTNEMTGAVTYYDDYGREKYVVDFNGYIQRTFLYADVMYVADESDLTRRKLKEIKVENNTSKTGLLTSIRDYTHNMYSVDNSSNAKINPLVYNETFFDLEGKTTCIKNTDGVITREYHYKQDDKGNKILDFHVDNLTKNKTYYDEHGTASYTVNAQDVVITRYFDGYTVNIQKDGSYAEVTKYDIDGKELYTTLKNIDYNDDGTINTIMDEKNNIWKEYHYKTDEDGNKVISYVKNCADDEFGGETYTWYQDGKPLYVTDTLVEPKDYTSSNIVKEYHWTDDTLNCTSNRKTGTVRWYNMNKELVYESLNEVIISKNIYSNGQLVGKWDAQKGETTIFVNERAWIAVKSTVEPTTDMVTSLIAHTTEIDIAIANHQEAKVLDGYMKSYGWQVGEAQKLLVKGPEYIEDPTEEEK